MSGYTEVRHTCQGRKLFCKYSQKGTPTVLFIAGLGDSCESWNVVQDRIARFTSTLSYDRAGIGRSEAPALVPRTCHDLAQELSELLPRIPVEPPFIVVGHSFGGLVARLFASCYPAWVSGIVLVDAAAEYKELAYEKVLPEKLIAGNRAYLENPLLNQERIDKLRSYKEIADHSWHGDTPLSIITRGLPDQGDEEWPHREILQIEQRLQADFQRLSTSTRHRIAERSGHDIHQDEPDIVVEEIMIMLEGWGK
ncbi:alpha/beta fold hydrolase [Brevibacillus borstelensis]|uniref:alpha/beta fold hydrolase n=1 Tax=Brevibacillus borstelensis TaxID=45462 RepID=UPI0030C05E60